MKYAFAISVILFCALELSNAHLMDSPSYSEVAWSNLVGLEIILLAIAGYFSKTKRHKSVLFVLSLWMCWVFATDWTGYFPAWLASWEATAFCVLICWTLTRPVRLPNYLGPNVSLAFYDGLAAPVLARIASLFGLPYSGVAVVMKGYVMWPDGKSKKLVKREMKRLPPSWTILDAGQPVSVEIEKEFAELEGKDISYAGCIRAIKPVLDILGYLSRTPGGLAMEVLDGGR